MKEFDGLRIVAMLLALTMTANWAAAQSPAWVSVGTDGKLRYQTTEKGDRILDFSHAGYGGGGVALPQVENRREVSPSGGEDDSPAIQAAIDAVGAMPLSNGSRGAVLLKPGTFRCATGLIIKEDGVVLRGSGSGGGGSVIEMAGSPHTCVSIAGQRLRYPRESASAAVAIADAYVPSGSASFLVKDARRLAVGDAVRIRWPRTGKWIHFMEMDHLVRDGKAQTWIKEDSLATFDRAIAAIAGNRITLDVPLTDAIDCSFLPADAAVVIKTTLPKRLSQCAVESLRINSPPPGGTLAQKNNTAISLENCEDCWIRDIAMHDVLNNVEVGGAARRITISQTSAVHTATVEKGAGYPADIGIRGSQVLVERCSSKGSGAFYVATLDGGAALNVVLNCTFEGGGSIQPHMRWSTGMLVDSCRLPQGRIEFINRRTSGSGHGWAMGWAVAWNSIANSFDIQQPPGAVNWCIGCTGAMKKTAPAAGAWLNSFGAPVRPGSLYLAQLRERLGDGAVKAIGY